MFKIRKTATALALVASALILSGCGERVEVPPASVGMVMGANGFVGEIIPPSRFRLSPCLFMCDKLVVIEAGDRSINENFMIHMPKERMDMGIGVRMTIALSQDKDEIGRVFGRVSPVRLDSGNFGTDIISVYETYGSAIVANAVRGILSTQSIADVSGNQAALSEKLRLAIVEGFKRTPLEVREFTLTEIRMPESIKTANEVVGQRQAEIAKADAEAQVRIREAQARLEVQRAEREADLLAAQTTAEMNKILAEGVTAGVLRYMELQVLQEVAKNQNTIFFPLDMVGSTALQNRVMTSDMKRNGE